MPIHIRRAEESDVPAIRDIYNYAIRELAATFDTEEKSLDDRRAWFARHGDQHPIFVAVEEGRILGWASLSPYGDRLAFRYTVDDSLYLRPDATGRGIGTLLMTALMHAAREHGHHAVIALITGKNAASIALHAKFGFRETGIMHEVGWKFGQWHDLIIMEALLR